MSPILSYFGPVAFLSELLGKLERPAHDIRAKRLQEWARSAERAVPGAEATHPHDRAPGAVTEVDSMEPLKGVETDVVDNAWDIAAQRQQLFGIRFGLRLILEGATCEGWRKQLRALHTEYQPLPAPESG